MSAEKTSLLEACRGLRTAGVTMTWRIPIHDDDSGEVIETRDLCARCFRAEFEAPVSSLSDQPAPVNEPCHGAPCRKELHDRLPTAWDRLGEIGDEP